MTNREKINKMSDEELVKEIIFQNCSLCANQNHYEECGLGGDPLRIDCENGIMEWLKWDAELTADEMFEEFGYKKSFDGLTGEVEYENKFNSKIRIMPVANGSYHYKKTTHNIADYITEAENKAIIKKIEELKKEE